MFRAPFASIKIVYGSAHGDNGSPEATRRACLRSGVAVSDGGSCDVAERRIQCCDELPMQEAGAYPVKEPLLQVEQSVFGKSSLHCDS